MRRTAGALITTILLWSSAFAGIRASLQGYSPWHVALGRFLVASLLLGIVAMFRRTGRPDVQDLPRIVAVGVLGIAIYNLALNYGETSVAAGPASFIILTNPVFTALFASLLLRERVPAIGWLGMAISLGGVGIIAMSESGGIGSMGGSLAILFAAICQSLYFVLQKPLLTKYGAYRVVCYSMWAGTIGLLVVAPGLVTAAQQAPGNATLALLYLGVFPSAIAFFCWSYVLERMPASRAAMFLYLVPLSALGFGFLWLGETPAALSIVGGIVALTGVAIVQVAGRSALRAKTARVVT